MIAIQFNRARSVFSELLAAARQNRLVLSLACLTFIVGLSASASAQPEIWSGNDVSFTKPNGANWLLEANQDRITPDTWITRQGTMGPFNIRTEAAFVAFVSPANTEWAYDLFGNGNEGLLVAATNYRALTFETWQNAINSFPPGIVGFPAVLHLISEDIYIDFTMTVWGGDIPVGLGGGFSYTRAADAPEPSSMLLSFCALTTLAGLNRHRRRRGSKRERRTR
jgi:hypothetical protein